MKRVEFAPAARAELDAAAEWYEEERPGRGVRLYAAVERSVQLIASFPSAGSPYLGVSLALGVRSRVVQGFPFVILYRNTEEVIRIDAVAHTRRRPGYWVRRVKR